jgi:hypothetical protein
MVKRGRKLLKYHHSDRKIFMQGVGQGELREVTGFSNMICKYFPLDF